MSNWKDKIWTQEEVDFLHKYSSEGLKHPEIAKLLGRSYESVHAKWAGLKKIKIRNTRPWTKEEEQLLINKYVELGPDTLSAKLNRSRKSIIIKVHNLGAPRRQDTRKEWTKEEEEILQKYYSQISPSECANKLNRSVNSIFPKARELKLTNDDREFWTPEEEERLKKYSQEWSIADLQELLQRSRMSIIRHRQVMSLPTKPDDYKGKDGNFYDSKQEKDVADLFYNAKIKYKKNTQKFYYDDGSWFRPDFIIGLNMVVEYFGLFCGPYPDYQDRINRKVAFFNSHKEYVFVALYPSDLRNGRIVSKVKEVL
jgi:hypothetical protein